jgi:hypothetical protein
MPDKKPFDLKLLIPPVFGFNLGLAMAYAIGHTAIPILFMLEVLGVLFVMVLRIYKKHTEKETK